MTHFLNPTEAQLAQLGSLPQEAQLAKLGSLPQEAPLAVLNLFRFNAEAGYRPEDPEFGTEAARITGREAWAAYAAAAGKAIVALGGRVVFSTRVEQLMIGPEEAHWELAAVMYFPTRKAFVELLSDPDFQAVSRHRKAALADHCMIHLAGESFA